MTTALAFFQLLEEASEEAVRQGESSQICCFKESEKGWELSLLWDPRPGSGNLWRSINLVMAGACSAGNWNTGAVLVFSTRRGADRW